MEEEEIAIIFAHYYNEKLDAYYLQPVSLAIGNVIEKGYMFKDYIGHTIYLNTSLLKEKDFKVSFLVNEKHKVKELKEEFKTETLQQLLNKYWQYLYKRTYIYDCSTNSIKIYSSKEFEKAYSISMKYPNYQQKIDAYYSFITNTTDEELEDFEKDPIEKEEVESDKLNIKETKIDLAYNKIREYVVSQDKAVKEFLCSFYNHYLLDNKSTVLLYGPTGTGKTEIARTISKVFDIPISIIDMNRYTSAGYVGKSIDDILVQLYYNADEDIEKAQKSIVYLDEIDKKASTGNDQREIVTTDVLNNLLKMIEGETFDIEIDKDVTISFDTSKLFFVLAGAFSNIKEKNSDNKKMGFGATKEIVSNENNLDYNHFIKYGLPPEFMSRIKKIVKLNPLEIPDLIKIFTTAKNSCLNKYIQDFKEREIELIVTKEAIEKIASQAKMSNMGARQLNSIMDKAMEDITYKLFNQELSNVTKIVVTDSTITDNKNYEIITKTIKTKMKIKS